MKINSIHIENFKSVKNLDITDIDNTLIVVGKNNTGKTVVLDAIRAVTSDYLVSPSDFFNESNNIVIELELELLEEDIINLYTRRLVSKIEAFDLWKEDFIKKLIVTSLEQSNIIYVKYIYDTDGKIKYYDKNSNINPYIKQILPKIYFIDHTRDISNIQKDIFKFQGNHSLDDLKQRNCIVTKTRQCNNCFDCISEINAKSAQELTIHETAKLMEYKLYNLNLSNFSEKINYYMEKNGAFSYFINYNIEYNIDNLLNVSTVVSSTINQRTGSLETLSTGIKSIYILSLLEAYSEIENKNPSIIIVEEPELHLHPQLQKTASEILYNISKKNQVMFSTHAPSMVTNFSMRQIRQIILDENYNSIVAKNSEIDDILDDLGYAANDLMNVSFVFIVEGKQDKNRLPLLLEKYYSDIHDESGNLRRISIITTNSCTNIKTYANLKYINQLYLKDQFLMIRDSDGKNADMLKKQLTSYYYEREIHDNNIPRITAENVLILKYYSFENYFLDPVTMTKIGVVSSEEQFYNILYGKYRDYLYKLNGFKKIQDINNGKIKSKEDIKNNMELIKTYVRGHNLFDIFYGKYKGDNEEAILKKYIDVAPKEIFADILNAINSFFFFENIKKTD